MPHTFTPRAGQTDYTHIHWAPVMNCVVMHNKKILVLQRSAKVNFYPEYWNGISGFLDDDRSLLQKVKEELREEAGIQASKIKSIRLAEIFDQPDKKSKKTWIVHPIIVEVITDQIKLDWESQNFGWFTLKELKKLNLLPGFELVLEKIRKPKVDLLIAKPLKRGT